MAKKDFAIQKDKPQVGTYYSIEVKDGKATIDGVSVSTDVADGKYDVKVWTDGSISFYYEGYIEKS